MAYPFFYIENFDGDNTIRLNEETSKHIVQVLRMKAGEIINLTDGKGNLLTCSIFNENKKQCIATVKSKVYQQSPETNITVAISLLKNTNRFEWFLEKATEIGVTEIIPLLCERTEKEKFRQERLKGIVISAMLQSQQCRLPLLHEPQQFSQIVIQSYNGYAKYIAHCDEDNNKSSLKKELISQARNKIILIGPEGDFSPKEIEQARMSQYIPVSLGETRLRTETAGIVASVLLRLM